ncbi:hypothetical protein HPB47_011443 [Ixodes persulcatus]|uniref:Uncharacterized protein n=1 Tax=Ixodes persulcatus TaxID=34615 RepID=A0AC60NW98_IXOPE|nr:hypothetical protein HPB47_011443 [Ixodes persulcatus]
MMNSYTIQRKVEVVLWHKKNGDNVSKTARHFELDRKGVREWSSNYQSLLQRCHGKNKFKRAINNGRPVSSEELDEALMDFLDTERAAGRAINLVNFEASNHYLAR